MPTRSTLGATARSYVRLRRLPVVPLMLVALSACMIHSSPPEDLDLSRSRASEGGLFRGTVTPNGSIPINRIHAWTLRVETATGDPVVGASVRIDGGMPEHGHGLPTQPRVTKELRPGEYLVEGMKFNMPGWWVLKVRVQAEAGTDSATYNLVL